jgi:branched-chain amino acid transport system ATP-binding protein
MSAVTLRTTGISKRWGSFTANDAITLSFPPGVRHALIGPNGAGKTTFVNLVTGQYPPSSGEVLLGEQRITHLSEHGRVKRGITRTYQVNTLFAGLTPLESVVLAICERDGVAGTWSRTVASHRREEAEADSLLESLHLGAEADTPTRELAYGKQRLLEIALALATKPKILILDEPASGVPAAESAEVFDVIAALPADVTIIFVEHDMQLVFRFAQRITVLVAGKVFADGTPQEIAADARVREVYLGEGEDG